MRYRIVWQYVDRDVRGKGDPEHATLKSAERRCALLNNSYPRIHHWVEAVEQEPVATSQDAA
ncbi:MAG: hypothetical protein P8180_07470 [Gammaproteobacteria bacterium]|jgi:hypothetical protein